MFNYMGCDEQAVQEGVKKYGLAVGARKMIDAEYDHAVDSIQSGVYITYANPIKKEECARLGKHSKCFCSHLLGQHDASYFGKKRSTICKNCPCKSFRFVPSRPEECGMYWLVRRKDFDVASWRPPCKCKHTNQEHKTNYPLKCNKCNCFEFHSNFACLTCDGSWEDHQTLFEMGEERQYMKKPVGQAYLPLSTHKNIQKQVFKSEKFEMIKGKSLPPSERQKQHLKEIHDKLNPLRPSKAEQAKLKSPLGIVLKPKYPDFMKR